MDFIRLDDNRVIHLAQVTDICHRTELGASSKLEGVVISFGHPEHFLTVYSTDEGYHSLLNWIAEQPTLEDIQEFEEEEEEASTRSFDGFEATLEHGLALLNQYESDVLGAVSPELRKVFDHFKTAADMWLSGEALA